MTATSPELSALLIEAPVGRHFAQLHRDSKALCDAVVLFIGTGLRRGNGVIVIASPENEEAFLEGLSEAGLNPEACRRSGQLTVLDAEVVLRRFMRGGMPDWSDFRRTVGGVIDGSKAFGRTTTRAYGEMVNILWRRGEPQAAIKLEEYWNELARIYPFSLFCGYMLDCQDHDSYSGPLHDIGRTHDHVIATQDDDRFRDALDAASKDVFGVPLAEMLSLSRHEDNPGEERLPAGQRTMLWIMRHMPASSAEVLERAREYYRSGGD